MVAINIKEIKSNEKEFYKSFFLTALIEDEDCFRISLTDELNEGFPTNDLEDYFTLGAYYYSSLVGVISFEREGASREKLRHKGIIFRMYVAREHRRHGVG